MIKLNFGGPVIEKTSEERALEMLYVYAADLAMKEKNRCKNHRHRQNRNPRFVGH